jgi:hypothetical protein
VILSDPGGLSGDLPSPGAPRSGCGGLFHGPGAPRPAYGGSELVPP